MSDLIKRSDAIKAAEDGMCTFYDCDVLDRLNAAPSADRPQGKWMSPTADSYITANFYKCSICGKIVNLFQMRSYNFCPNCGARMKGADDETIRTEDI